MGSDYLKAIAAGGEFDQAEAIREIARTLTEGPIEVVGQITGSSFKPVVVKEEARGIEQGCSLLTVEGGIAEGSVTNEMGNAPAPARKKK